MTLALLLLVIGLPGLGAALLLRRSVVVGARRIAAAVVGLDLLVSIGLSARVLAEGPADHGFLLGPTALLHTDALSAVVVPFAALLALLVVLAYPRFLVTPQAMGRMALALAAAQSIFLTANPLLLSLLWVGAVAPPYLELKSRPVARRTARVFALYMGLSALSLCVGFALLALADLGPPGATWIARAAVTSLLLAVMVRKGVAPFHAWFPEVFARGSLGGVLLLTLPQVGAYAVVRFVVPLLADALPIELYVLSGISLLTAVYGAAVGLVQREVRPALGYLAMSQSALSLAGLTGSTPDLLVGGLLMWISSGLALTGLGLSVWMLEARAGTLSLRQPGGHYRTAPALAVCFLFFGLASVGFPGTLSFVADDLLISAALGRAVGPNLALVAASAMNAVAVLRAWFTLFGGPASPQMSPHELVPRERVAAGGLILLIVALGLSPGPLLHLLERAATELAAPLISAP